MIFDFRRQRLLKLSFLDLFDVLNQALIFMLHIYLNFLKRLLLISCRLPQINIRRMVLKHLRVNKAIIIIPILVRPRLLLLWIEVFLIIALFSQYLITLTLWHLSE